MVGRDARMSGRVLGGCMTRACVFKRLFIVKKTRYEVAPKYGRLTSSENIISN